MFCHQRHEIKTGDIVDTIQGQCHAAQMSSRGFQYYRPRDEVYLPRIIRSRWKNNVDKVLALFIKAAFDGVFCNHVGWFLKSSKFFVCQIYFTQRLTEAKWSFVNFLI
jgi:hypothetical protein